MFWIYEKLMVLWDNLYNRHEKAMKIILCALLLTLCGVTALVELYQMMNR